MNKGKVRWFNNQKGFGFIRDEEGNDVFVHYFGINMNGFKHLEEGQEVTFDVEVTEKGKQAVNVTVVEKTSKEDFEKMVDVINNSAQKLFDGSEE